MRMKKEILFVDIFDVLLIKVCYRCIIIDLNILNSVMNI